MISHAPAGFEAFSLSDQFTQARGAPFSGLNADGFETSFDTGLEAANAATLHGAVSAVPAVLDPMGFFSGKPAGGDNPQTGQTADLQQQLNDVLTKPAQSWKPADRVNENKVMRDAQGYSKSHAEPKAQAAQQMQAQQVGKIEELTKKMADGKGGPVVPGAPSAPAAGSPLASAAGYLAKDAGITLAASAIGGAPAVIGVTALMAAASALRGGGTLATMGQTSPDYSRLAAGKGKPNRSSFDTGYNVSVSASPAAASAPVSTAFQARMNDGPGFGMPAPYRRDMANQVLTDKETILNMAAESPAGQAAKSMHTDAKYAIGVIRTQKDGVDATAENSATAENLGVNVNPAQPKIMTFHPGPG